MLDYSFANACRKWLIPLEDIESENDNAGEKAGSPIQLPKVSVDDE